MILIGDNNGYPGLSYDLIRDFKDRLKARVLVIVKWEKPCLRR